MKRSIPVLYSFLFAVVATIATALLIYLTPLHHFNLVEPKIRDIDPVAIYDQMKANPDGYLFVDVRPQASYDQMHAAESINIPLHTLYTERYQLPKHGKTIVLICSGGLASGVAFGYLEHYGFLNLVRVAGGIEAWQDRGLPVVAKKNL